MVVLDPEQLVMLGRAEAVPDLWRTDTGAIQPDRFRQTSLFSAESIADRTRPGLRGPFHYEEAVNNRE